MNRYLVVLCLAVMCRCEIGRDATTKLMVNRLTEISTLLKSTLDDGMMRESSALSTTLKELSSRYAKNSKAQIKEKTSGRLEIEAKPVKKLEPYDIIDAQRAVPEKIRSREIEDPEEEYRYSRRAEETPEKYVRKSKYSDTERRDRYAPKRRSDRYKDSQPIRDREDEYDVSSYARRPKPIDHTYEDGYSQDR